LKYHSEPSGDCDFFIFSPFEWKQRLKLKYHSEPSGDCDFFKAFH